MVAMVISECKPVSRLKIFPEVTREDIDHLNMNTCNDGFLGQPVVKSS